MPHSVSLISTIDAGLGLVLIFGFIAAYEAFLEGGLAVSMLVIGMPGKIILGEEELAQSMMRYVLERSAFAQCHT